LLAIVCRFYFQHRHGQEPKCKRQETGFRNFHFLQSPVNGAVLMISDPSVSSADFESNNLILLCGSPLTALMNNSFFHHSRHGDATDLVS
jgi:hypothetical protein